MRSTTTDPDLATRDRLLEAATQVFADCGLRKATVRDICARATCNVASVNYHFGSKDELYVATLRGAMAKCFDQDLSLPEGDARVTLRAAIQKLAAGILVARPATHQKLMMRELVEPSAALDRVVKEFMVPRFQMLRTAVAPFLGRVSARTLALHVLSVIAQLVYYRVAQPVALRMLGEKSLDEKLCAQIVTHVTEFSMRALEAAR